MTTEQEAKFHAANENEQTRELIKRNIEGIPCTRCKKVVTGVFWSGNPDHVDPFVYHNRYECTPIVIKQTYADQQNARRDAIEKAIIDMAAHAEAADIEDKEAGKAFISLANIILDLDANLHRPFCLTDEQYNAIYDHGRKNAAYNPPTGNKALLRYSPKYRGLTDEQIENLCYTPIYYEMDEDTGVRYYTDEGLIRYVDEKLKDWRLTRPAFYKSRVVKFFEQFNQGRFGIDWEQQILTPINTTEASTTAPPIDQQQQSNQQTEVIQ